MRQVCCGCYDGIRGCNRGVSNVLVFEEDCDGDASGARGWGPYFPAVIMLIGGTDDKSFCAVLCKRLATIRLSWTSACVFLDCGKCL